MTSGSVTQKGHLFSSHQYKTVFFLIHPLESESKINTHNELKQQTKWWTPFKMKLS